MADGLPRLGTFDFTGAVVLVTGGGSGIGFGLVEEFLKLGAAKVLITGRREAVLKEAADKHPGKIAYHVADAGSAADREALFRWAQEQHPDCSVLVNNAGIQRRVPLSQDNTPWAERATEIAINLEGPVHLCSLFVPHFLTKPSAMIANVTSGLAFIPFTAGPVYAATKAALHSYTMSLRWSIEGTPVRVVEIAPPAVKTNLGGSHDFGEDCGEFCAHVMARVAAGEQEVGYKMSDTARVADRVATQQSIEGMSKMMQVKRYSAAA